MGKGRTTIQAPDPINPGQAQGEYLFGQNFTDFQGVTDPRLQSRLIAAERAFRPQYTALELADIQTLAQGTQAGQANPEYQRIQQELAGLRAGDQVAEAGASAEFRRQVEIEANAIFPEKERENRDQKERREEKIQKYIDDKLENPVERNAARAERIATLESQLASTPQTLEGTSGLFDLLGEASADAANLQREQLGLQREADVAALREFSPQVVDAYRRADPSSANLAQLSAERAGDFSIREQDLRNSVEAFNSITRKLLRAGENVGSEQFQDSLTDGEAYYLYQAGLINADKSPKKRFTAENLRDEVIKADTDIQSIQAGTFQPDPSDKIGAVGETLLGRGVQDASDAEQTIQARGQADAFAGREAASDAESAIQARSLSDLNAQLQAASGAEQALASRGLSDTFARREAASAAERQLQQMGSTLGDLSPTEQEALISGRGSEFIQSTGELTPLELRRAQQAARQASVARGRGLGQGALADEIANRFAQETNKREREIALGAQLLGQEASMRGTRLGQGAGFLQDSEGLAAQRRAEQLQRQMFGSQNLAQAEGLAAQRRAEQFQRQQAGLQGLALTDDQIARRRAEQFQRQQAGVGTLGLAEQLAARRRGEDIQGIQLGAGLIGQQQGLQSNRLGQAFDMSRSLSGDLGNIILGRPSSAIRLGQQTLGQAQAGAAGPMGPQLFDPNVGINMALQNQANQFGLLGAQAQADATRSAGGLGFAGGILGGILSRP